MLGGMTCGVVESVTAASGHVLWLDLEWLHKFESIDLDQEIRILVSTSKIIDSERCQQFIPSR